MKKNIKTYGKEHNTTTGLLGTVTRLECLESFFAQKQGHEVIYIESSFFACQCQRNQGPKTKPRNVNCIVSEIQAQTCHNIVCMGHLERIVFFSAVRMCHDRSVNHPVTHKCFPIITVTSQRAPSQLCTALHFVTAGNQSADSFRSKSDLQDQWAGPWTKDLKPETSSQERIIAQAPPHKHAACQHHLGRGEHVQLHRFCGSMEQDPFHLLHCGFWSLCTALPFKVALVLPSLPGRSFQAFAATSCVHLLGHLPLPTQPSSAA